MFLRAFLHQNKVHIGHYTLVDKPIQNQANATETIVAWDIENEKWQDIRVSTITQFIGIPDQ